jgi:hypothetical protein
MVCVGRGFSLTTSSTFFLSFLPLSISTQLGDGLEPCFATLALGGGLITQTRGIRGILGEDQ